MTVFFHWCAVLLLSQWSFRSSCKTKLRLHNPSFKDSIPYSAYIYICVRCSASLTAHASTFAIFKSVTVEHLHHIKLGTHERMFGWTWAWFALLDGHQGRREPSLDVSLSFSRVRWQHEYFTGLEWFQETGGSASSSSSQRKIEVSTARKELCNN